MSSVILPHGLERASAHYIITTKELSYTIRQRTTFGKLSPRRGFPSIIAFDVRQYQYVKQLSLGRVRTSPFAANLTPNCGTVVLATDCKSLAFSAPFSVLHILPNLKNPLKQ